ncbi:MAG: zinc ribbon domain-containing protein [Planctomycetaceae bacterium]|nr:zinc ribbon domain-containing protein [Planctomycetaceae bacterium]
MPIYEYACLDCGREFEELVRGDEKPACPGCGRTRVERQMSAPSGHVVGGGSACPARDVCGSSHCCGPNCHLH